jgi:hypothetical protein
MKAQSCGSSQSAPIAHPPSMRLVFLFLLPTARTGQLLLTGKDNSITFGEEASNPATLKACASPRTPCNHSLAPHDPPPPLHTQNTKRIAVGAPQDMWPGETPSKLDGPNFLRVPGSGECHF